MVSVIVIVVIAVIAYYAVRDLRRYWALRQFQGPPLCGFTRYWMFKSATSGRLQHYYKDWSVKYGPTCRIGPNFLLTKDLAVIKQINAVRGDYSRSDWFVAARMHPTQDNITSYMDDKIHTKYSGKDNPHLEQDIDTAVLKMVDLIQSKYLSSPSNYVQFDLARMATFFTLDTLAAVAYGRSFGFLDKDEDPFGYLEQTKIFWPLFQFMATFPELHNIIRIPFIRKLWPTADDVQGLGAIMHFAQELVAERFGPNPVVRKDMLGSFMAHGMLAKAQLEAETLIQISAGSDSTATAIRMALLHICTNPRVLASLRRELDAAVRSGAASRPVIRDQEARRLPYLQACIKETLRVVPPAAGLLPKRVPGPAGDTIAGVWVPPGTDVGWNIQGLMRDEALFGPDADLFRPERWLLEPDDAKLARMLDAQSIIFGSGKYGCLGRHVASFELDKAIAELVLRFEWELADVKDPLKSLCMGFHLQEQLFFRVTERKVVGGGDVNGEEAWEKVGAERRDFGLETKWEDV
ncbi:Cytochrome P450 [Lasiodiplodia theobromae]|uniref:Cytochrome P450 n=1 Tax=Lasiodiplodia theobromae TaxID=45133 RepID=UPI0015C364A7|nr:Cytochrome P450 [Lasiodiplodia theobromae]KAF4542190.1 Cytochrome P450 [Lasiodiplodia theobromae]